MAEDAWNSRDPERVSLAYRLDPAEMGQGTGLTREAQPRLRKSAIAGTQPGFSRSQFVRV